MTEQIVPVYRSVTANSSVFLATDSVALSAEGRSVSGVGTATLDLEGKQRVVVEVCAGSEAHLFLHSDDIRLKFGPHGLSTPVLATRSTINNSNVTFSLIARKGPLIISPRRRAHLAVAVTHILNFPDFFCLGGKGTDFHRNGRRLGRVVLLSRGWQVEIQALSSTRELVEQLKAQGGNAITHVARISRADGNTFTRTAVEVVLNHLQRFLSFARGAWTSLFGTVGYDRNGGNIYQNWGMRIGAPWQVGRGWFDIHHGEWLAEAFPGFVELLYHPQLGRSADAALYWYLRSNRAGDGAGVDGGLILAQAALEGLSTSVLEDAGITLAPRPNAAEKLRAACSQLELSAAIPPSSKALGRGRRNGDFADAPEAITRLRNDLVHPKQRLKTSRSPLIPEAWHLAQWYIEAMLLRLAGYQGMYSNRLTARWVGQIQTFP